MYFEKTFLTIETEIFLYFQGRFSFFFLSLEGSNKVIKRVKRSTIWTVKCRVKCVHFILTTMIHNTKVSFILFFSKYGNKMCITFSFHMVCDTTVCLSEYIITCTSYYVVCWVVPIVKCVLFIFCQALKNVVTSLVRIYLINVFIVVQNVCLFNFETSIYVNRKFCLKYMGSDFFLGSFV